MSETNNTPRRNLPIIPIIIIGLVIFCGVFGPTIAPQDPTEGDLFVSLMPPFESWDHPLGTDHLGRDILSRIIVGARISMIVGVLVVVFAGSLGALMALLSGYLGGKVDQVIMRITDTILSIPYLMLAVVMAAILGPSMANIIILLSLLGWTRYARVLRGEVLRIKNSDFVKLAKIDGCSNTRILGLHIFPNIVNTLIILATLQVGVVIIIEASLSFLGLGVPPPAPSWGGMLADSRSYIGDWWLSTFPGVAIMLTVMASNLLGEWLRLRLDPKFRQM
jgi:peptide/nickel transport system permease protein